MNGHAKKVAARLVTRVLGLPGVLLGIGLALYGNPEMFWLWASVIGVALVVALAGLLYENRSSKIGISVVALISVAALVLYFAFVVFPKAPLTIHASVFSPAYEEGILIGKVQWSRDYARLAITFTNGSEQDYSDVDVSVTVPHVLVIDVSQESKFECAMGFQVRPLSFTVRARKPSGEIVDERREGNVAANVPYRIRCGSLPRLMTLELAVTIARIKHKQELRGPDGAVTGDVIAIIGPPPSVESISIQAWYRKLWRPFVFRNDKFPVKTLKQ